MKRNLAIMNKFPQSLGTSLNRGSTVKDNVHGKGQKKIKTKKEKIELMRSKIEAIVSKHRTPKYSEAIIQDFKFVWRMITAFSRLAPFSQQND